MSAAPTVAVVVDNHYGDRLLQLAHSGPVWIVDTEINRPSAEKQWAVDPTSSYIRGVTIFNSYGVTDPAQIFLNIFGVVDLHHGEYSSDPPYGELQVLGTTATTIIKDKVSEFGFVVSESTKDYFRAVRNLDYPDFIQ
jgi:hypothetical protein